jgi:hypothetical protein
MSNRTVISNHVAKVHLIHQQIHLCIYISKTVVMEEMERINNGEDPNPFMMFILIA